MKIMQEFKMAKTNPAEINREMELSKILAQISGVILTLIVMLRIALFQILPQTYINPLSIASIFIVATLVLSVINLKIIKEDQNKLMNWIAMSSLFIGMVILVAIISIVPTP